MSDDVVGGRRKLHNEVFRDLYKYNYNDKSRRMRGARHVAQMRRRGARIGYWYESKRERDH
jgi:hypothetical protein